MIDSGYLGLASAAFLAATILPFSSEAALAGMLLSESFSILALWLAATLGNVAGAVVNWWLGGRLEHFKNHRWFPVGPTALARAEKQFHRYGQWGLLLAWVPIVGDPLTVIAGLLRTPLWLFIPLVTIGKGGRYAFIIWILHG